MTEKPHLSDEFIQVQSVPSVLTTKASKKLEDKVKEELENPDPEKAEAVLAKLKGDVLSELKNENPS